MISDDNLDKARDSTTLAVNTEFFPMRALVDWVSCSFHLDVTASEIYNFLGIEDLSTLEEISGARYEFAGYDMTYKLGAIELMQDSKENRWLLNMSGQGCRQYEISSSFDMITMFALLGNVFATYTRLDIAIDDFKGIYNVDTIRKAVFKKQCVTKLTKWGNGTRGNIANGDDFLTMDNFYLGTSSSRYFLNVYDKLLEQKEKEKELPVDMEGNEVTTWTRTEIRFRYEYAQQFVAHILTDSNDLGYHIKSFLNDRIQFVTLSALEKDSNKSRLAEDKKNICKWWRTFLNGAGRLHLSVYRPDKTLLESKSWLFDKVSTTLAMLHLYSPEEYDTLIRDLTIEGLDKMKKKHITKVENQVYLDNHGIKVIPAKEDDVWVSTKKPTEEVRHKKRPTIENLKDSYWGQVADQQKYDANILEFKNEQKKETPDEESQ